MPVERPTPQVRTVDPTGRPVPPVSLGGPTRASGLRVAIVGSSMEYNGGNGDLQTPSTLLLLSGWPVALNIISGGALDLHNYAVGGAGTTQMRASQLPNVWAMNPLPHALIIGVGPNDSKGGVSLATSQAEITAMLDQAEARGVYAIVLTPTPSDRINTTDERTAYWQLVEWVLRLPRTRRGVMAIDVASTVVSHSATTAVTWGVNALGQALSTDATHSNSVGGLAMAQTILSALSKVVALPAQRYSGPANPLELLSNPRMTGDTAGLATGVKVIAQGAGASATPLKVPRTDGIPGDWQEITFVNTTGGYVIQENLVGPWTPGERLTAAVEVVNPAGGWSSSTNYVLLDCRRNAVPTQLLGATCGGSSAIEPPIPWGLYSQSVTVPTGTTKVRVVVFFKGSGVLRIAYMSLKRG